MNIARWLCSTVGLPGSELIVAGGYQTLNDSDTVLTDQMEILSL